MREGLAHLQRGAARLAVPHFQRATQTEPRNFEALYNLALALLSIQQFAAALPFAERALAARPASPQAHTLLGEVLAWLERYEDAVGHLVAALITDPANWQVLARLSGLLMWLNRSGEMMVWLERAVATNPRLAAAQQMLGSLYLSHGRLDEARQALEIAVALEPRNARFQRLLSEAICFVPGDPHLAALEKLQRGGAALPPDDKADLNFALAKAYDDIGRREDAFRHLADANKIARGQFSYDEANILAAFARVRAVFTPQFLSARTGSGDPSPAPVFIVGMPRAGTTLIEQILAGHPEIKCAGESRAFPKALGALVQNYPDDVPPLGDGELRQIGVRYLDGIRAEAGDAARVTDKMLPNFLLIGLIHMALPNARFIHAVRDPVDTCLSIYATHFHEAQPYAYDLREIGRYYAAYRGLMAHWHAVLPKGVILDVAYEDVVGGLEGAARRMIAHCGLEWDASCLDFTARDRPVWTASAAQVRRPLYQTSVGRWRPPAKVLAPLLKTLAESA